MTARRFRALAAPTLAMALVLASATSPLAGVRHSRGTEFAGRARYDDVTDILEPLLILPAEKLVVAVLTNIEIANIFAAAVPR